MSNEQKPIGFWRGLALAVVAIGGTLAIWWWLS